MDEIDRNIVVALQDDGSSGLAELAKVAGLSVSATAERVKRLEERGVIRAWRAELDPAAVGCPLLAHVLAVVAPGQDDAAFREAMRRAEAVLECHAVSGAWTYLLKLRVADFAALDAFLNGVLRTLPGVQRVETIVAIATVKESAILPVAPAVEE
ncbi:MAG TPA: Lrp/AsnC family transcriptional regulator [Acetobacteraceae bacterium]|nr:Lrp/AsnC family transcriptional regulator [Acetobacteraceae bacterium]